MEILQQSEDINILTFQTLFVEWTDKSEAGSHEKLARKVSNEWSLCFLIDGVHDIQAYALWLSRWTH